MADTKVRFVFSAEGVDEVLQAFQKAKQELGSLGSSGAPGETPPGGATSVVADITSLPYAGTPIAGPSGGIAPSSGLSGPPAGTARASAGQAADAVRAEVAALAQTTATGMSVGGNTSAAMQSPASGVIGSGDGGTQLYEAGSRLLQAADRFSDAIDRLVSVVGDMGAGGIRTDATRGGGAMTPSASAQARVPSNVTSGAEMDRVDEELGGASGAEFGAATGGGGDNADRRRNRFRGGISSPAGYWAAQSIVSQGLQIGSIISEAASMKNVGGVITPEDWEMHQLKWWQAGMTVAGGILGLPWGLPGAGIGTMIGGGAGQLLLAPRIQELETQKQAAELATFAAANMSTHRQPEVGGSMVSADAEALLGEKNRLLPLLQGTAQFSGVLGPTMGGGMQFLKSMLGVTPNRVGVFESRTGFLSQQMADPLNAGLRNYVRRGGMFSPEDGDSSGFANISSAEALLAASQGDFQSTTMWGSMLYGPDDWAIGAAERVASGMAEQQFYGASASRISLAGQEVAARGGSPYRQASASRIAGRLSWRGVDALTSAQLEAQQRALSVTSDPSERRKIEGIIAQTKAQRSAGWVGNLQAQQQASMMEMGEFMAAGQFGVAMAQVPMGAVGRLPINAEAAFGGYQSSVLGMAGRAANAVAAIESGAWGNVPWETRRGAYLERSQTSLAAALAPQEVEAQRYQLATAVPGAQMSAGAAQTSMVSALGGWGAAYAPGLQESLAGSQETIAQAHGHLDRVMKLRARNLASDVQVAEARAQVAGAQATHASTYAQRWLLPSQSVVQAAGTAVSAWGAQAGAIMARGYGSEAALPAQFGLYGAMGTGVAASAELYQTSMAAFGSDSMHTMQARASMYQQQQALVEAGVRMAEYDPGSAFRMRQRATGFALSAATQTFTGYGEVRGLVREQMGQAEEQISGIRRLRSRLSAAGIDDPAVLERLQEQEIGAAGQWLQSEQTLEHGWQERMISQAFGMPGNWTMIARQFDPIRGVMDFGVHNRFYGGRGSDIERYRRQASLYANTVSGNPAHPVSSAANALLGSPGGRGYSLMDFGSGGAEGTLQRAAERTDGASIALASAAAALERATRNLDAVVANGAGGAPNAITHWEQGSGTSRSIGHARLAGTGRGF